MELVLDRCIIRSWQLTDAGSVAKQANSRKIWRNVRDAFPFPYTIGNAKEWIRIARADVPETHFAIEVHREAVGGIGVRLKEDVYRCTAEIGYWLGESYWGQGIVTEAVRALTDFAFANLGVWRVYADVFEWNPASMRVLEKAGYICEGRLRKNVIKDGQVIDALLYAKVRES
ncbi:MAG: GNAT family N-acetyltransferase [Acidobacteriia bacterium]|nr:GNAT family N-acetyltransferase [Terriglobia bacterium]